MKTLPLGGRDISEFILRRLRERSEPVPSEDMKEVVRYIKENYCYCCGNMMKEFTAFDEDRSRFKTYSGVNSRTKQVFNSSFTLSLTSLGLLILDMNSS